MTTIEVSPHRVNDRGHGRCLRGGNDMRQGTCSVAGCERPIVGKGLCGMHYQRLRKTGSLELVSRWDFWIQPTCLIADCDKPSRRYGWCQMHYFRWYRHGNPLTKLNFRGLTTEERYWKFVVPTKECWDWAAGLFDTGYAMVDDQGRTRSAHRVSYELHYGSIPEGLHIDHLCHNRDLTCKGGVTCLHRRCTRPPHLEAVTPAENWRRAREHKRLRKVQGYV